MSNQIRGRLQSLTVEPGRTDNIRARLDGSDDIHLFSLSRPGDVVTCDGEPVDTPTLFQWLACATRAVDVVLTPTMERSGVSTRTEFTEEILP
jgi:hypothetical protein